MMKVLTILITAIVLMSCQKAIEVKLPDVEQDIVVEGKIETGLPPIVFLTTTQGYFDETSADAIFGTYIHGAEITMSDGTNEFVLEEKCTGGLSPAELEIISQFIGIPAESLQYFDYCVYTSLDPNAFGKENTRYDLTIVTDTSTLTASTLIPGKVSLADPYWEPIGNLDSLGFMWATLNDPDTAGNSYRWYAQRINQYLYEYPDYPNGPVKGTMKDPFQIAPFGSVFDDKFFNGISFELEYNRGEIGNLEGPDDEGPEEGYFKRGDTVVIKFTTIDHSTFNHLRALENQAATNGSPFASPGNLPTTVVGGIGNWAGYAATFDTVICQ